MKLMKEVICPNCSSKRYVWKIAEEKKHNKIKVTWLCTKCNTEIETELVNTIRVDF